MNLIKKILIVAATIVGLYVVSLASETLLMVVVAGLFVFGYKKFADLTNKSETTIKILVKSKGVHYFLYCISVSFFLSPFIGAYYFFVIYDPAINAEIIASEYCDGDEYVVRDWTPFNFLQHEPPVIIVQKIGGMFDDNLVLWGYTSTEYGSRDIIYNNHWIFPEQKPLSLWDNGSSTIVSEFFIRSDEYRGPTQAETVCLQKVIPLFKEQLANYSGKIGTAFQPGVGIFWEQRAGFFNHQAYVQSSGEQGAFDLSRDKASKRIKKTGPVIMDFSYYKPNTVSMRIDYFDNQYANIGTSTINFYFGVTSEKKVNIPERIIYTPKLRYDDTYPFGTVTISYDEIVSAMREAYFKNGKTLNDLVYIEKTAPVIFEATTTPYLNVPFQ